MDARELLGVYVCIPCKDKAGHGVTVSIRWCGCYYSCEHISLKDIKESGYG